MKKALLFSALIIAALISMSFALIAAKNHAKNNDKKHHPKATTVKTEVAKTTCSCGTPPGLSAVRTGGTVHVSWGSVTGAVSYSVGGYRSCDPPYGFMYCATGTSIDIPSACYLTVQVTANCDGTTCTNATCSSTTPAGPVQSN